LRERASGRSLCGVVIRLPFPHLPMPPRPLPRIRHLCLALPEAHEVTAWGEPTFRVKNKMFATYASPDSHHGGGRPSVWCKSTLDNQALMIAACPRDYFKPAYVGPSGWIGVWLDRPRVWASLPELLEDAYRLVAPKRLLASLASPLWLPPSKRHTRRERS
jgi:hypothetical protein